MIKLSGIFLAVCALAISRIVFSLFQTSAHFVEILLPGALIIAGIFFLGKQRINERELPGKLSALALSATFLLSLGILSGGPIIITDYPINLHRIAKFSGVFYYDPSFGAGIVDSFVQPPGAFSIGATLAGASGLGGPAVVRVLAGLSFLLSSLAVGFFSSKGLGMGERFSSLSIIAWVAFPHDEFVHGMYSSYLALAIALASSGILLDCLRKDCRIPAVVPALYSASILCHILSGLAITLPILALAFLLYGKKIGLINLSLSALFSFFPSLFWLAPALASSSSYNFTKIPELYPFLSSPVEIFFRRFFFRTPESFILPLLLVPFLFSPKLWKKAVAPLILLSASVSLALLSFVPGEIFPEIFAQLMPDRFAMAARAFAVCIASYSLFIFRKRKGSGLLLVAFLAPVAFYSIASPTAFLGNSWAFSLLHGGGSFQDWFGIVIDGPLFSQKIPEELLEASFWAGGNLESRILFDDESSPSFGGHPAPLFQRHSGLELIGGPIPTATYWGADTQVFDGNFLGKGIYEYSREEFLDASEKLGISSALSKTDISESALAGMGFSEVARFGRIAMFSLGLEGPLPGPLKEFPFFWPGQEGEPATKMFFPKDGDAVVPEYSPPFRLKALEILSLLSFFILLVFGANQNRAKHNNPFSRWIAK